MLAMIVGGAFYGYVVGNISVILASNDVRNLLGLMNPKP